MICTKFWTDSKVKQLTPLEKLIFLYLISNPHTHISGLYYLPLSLATEELNAPVKWPAIWVRFAELDLAYYDEEQRLVWVCRMYGYQGRGETIDKSVSKHIQSFHPSKLIKTFLSRYKRIIPLLSKDFRMGDMEGEGIPPQGVPNTNTIPIPPLSSLNSPDLKSADCANSEPIPRWTCEDIRTRWNQIPGVRSCKMLDGALREKVQQLCREHDCAWWENLFAEISKSKFLSGKVPGREGARPFKVDLGWVTGPKNLGKVLAGNYDDGAGQPRRGVM